MSQKARIWREERGIGLDAIHDETLIRECIAAQMCPFCVSGPFKVLALHTQQIHEIDRFQLRDMAGFATGDNICSPEFSERARELAASDPGRSAKARAAIVNHDNLSRRWTRAGRERAAIGVSLASRSRMEALTLDERRAIMARLRSLITPQARAEAARKQRLYYATEAGRAAAKERAQQKSRSPITGRYLRSGENI